MTQATVLSLLGLATLAACAPRVAPVTATPIETVAPADRPRPRYDLDGRRLVFASGPVGKRRIQLQDLVTGETRELPGEGDDTDPTFTPDGRVVFASNRGGDYDLYRLDPQTGTTERITKLEGDEREPTVAPIPFGFYAVHNGICGGPADGTLIDGYQKVLFVRQRADTSEIWFSSLRPTTPLPAGARQPPPEPSPHGAHQGRVSAPGRTCFEPTFALDGLSAVWVCDGRIEDAPARHAQSFAAALAAVEGPAPAACRGHKVDIAACLPELHRQYATYPGRPVSAASQRLRRPSLSANQTVLIADVEGQPRQAPRFEPSPSWIPLELGEPSCAHLAWSPLGTEIAFAGAVAVERAATDHYLQTVRNLHRFPELFGSGESARLRSNRFVVRPGDQKEFHVLYEQLRYAGRPQFVTADAALQAFRDEFLRLLENGEKEAAKAVRALTRGLYRHYVARLAARPDSTLDRYYTVLFATAWVPLEATATMERASFDQLVEANFAAIEPGREVDPHVERLRRPAAARLPEELPRVLARLPAGIRAEVRAHLERMLAHEGLVELAVPGRARPLEIDFSQFAIRGAYAENDLAGYFLAMNWLGALPLPLDPSLRHLVTTLRTLAIEPDPLPPTAALEPFAADPSGGPQPPTGPTTAFALWRKADAVVGSLMGRPVDATVEQLAEELEPHGAFDAVALERRLLARRGPVPIRDASNRDRELFVTLFPKRLGLEVTFFRALTHPEVPRRGIPSSLDVFATLGNAQARQHALTAEEQRENYERALTALSDTTRASGGGPPGYASTDLYHSWLALLVTLASPPKLPDSSRLAFAKSAAWRDRQLYSALAGYTQLKHSAVLYAMQDMGVECDGGMSYHVAVEEPLVPAPRGFVEPNVAFFEGLATLARETYRRLHDDPDGPTASQWADASEPRLNALNLARDLAEIARAEVAGRRLTDEQARYVEFVGGLLEPLALGMHRDQYAFATGGQGRQERGVALVTDIHTNTDRQEALAIGIGRIFDLWVVVPGDVGESLTQGGVFSFYEFTTPMALRPTDADWGRRIDDGRLPPRPPWTESFIESR